MHRPFLSLLVLFMLPVACSHPTPAKKGSAGAVGGHSDDGAVEGGITSNGGVGGDSSLGGVVTGGQALGETGTSSSSCARNSICFRNGQAEGLFTGQGWVDLDTQSTLLSPTCGAENQLITANDPCPTRMEWSRSDALCMSGSIRAVDVRGEAFQWGMAIGVNAREPIDPLGSATAEFKSVSFAFSGDPKAGIRAILHRQGDGDATTYCIDGIRSDQAMRLPLFNTKCWGDISTVDLVPADLPKIDRIGLLVSSGSSDINVKDFCLERITFGN